MSGHRSDFQGSSANPHNKSQDDSKYYLFVGALCMLLLTISLFASALAVLMFAGTILAALQGNIATHPIDVSGGPLLTYMSVAASFFFLLACFLKAEAWGEWLVGEELREKRRMQAMALARRTGNKKK